MLSELKNFIPSIDNSLKRMEIFLILNAMKSHSQKSFYTRNQKSVTQYFNSLTDRDLEISLDKLPEFPNLKNFPFNSKRNFLFSFKTPYKPNKYFKDSWDEMKLVHDVKVHYYPYKNNNFKNRKALIYIHGWGKNSLLGERLWHFRFFQLKYKTDIYAIELPYHISRNPAGFSGQGFLDQDPVRTVEAFRQSIIEAMYLYKGLKQEYKKIGFAGISLGGHIVSYIGMFLNDDVFLLQCLAGTPFSYNVRRLQISPNLLAYMKENDIEQYLSILDYRNFQSHKNKQSYLFGGRFDSVIDKRTVLLLGKHLHCSTYIMPTGHFTFAFSLPYIVTKIAKF